ncbi:glycosyltransferase family 2 protein [Ancylobacter sp. 6x-1]|uniref:Glycosyltransferase family 2 protein n=1 Tax=Ancylobacter crimeensis TaxID=2579147 RepID=A0ABT0D9M9_9HYPH|nr:glycosyltransferase family 2 protein [Ancylobacter crimeensis]MCK0196609.1 glycosyltransferase family 2 protein [Ancylobacter crimeensis]
MPSVAGAPRVSVVIPAFEEAGNIGRLVTETFAAIADGDLGEVIVVDDCSADGTGAEVKALLATFPKLRYLRHATRAGQSAALRSGVLAARFPIIATMDGDGQNVPADIPHLLARLGRPEAGEEGEPALVGGIRAKRLATGSRRWASRFANGLRAWMLKDECPDTGCGIKVYRRDAFLLLPFFTSMHRYLPALFLSYGHEVAYVPVGDRDRLAGTSKYTNLGRALIGIYDLIGVTWLRRRTLKPRIAEDSRIAEDGRVVP